MGLSAAGLLELAGAVLRPVLFAGGMVAVAVLVYLRWRGWL